MTGMSRVELILMVQDGLNRHDLRFFLGHQFVDFRHAAIRQFLDNLLAATFFVL